MSRPCRRVRCCIFGRFSRMWKLRLGRCRDADGATDFSENLCPSAFESFVVVESGFGLVKVEQGCGRGVGWTRKCFF